MTEITPPALSRMVRQRTYDPVRQCIYCSASGDNTRLTEEHIIPLSLGGMLKLPEASCEFCQTVTSAFEGENAGKLFLPIRRQHKFPSRRRGKSQSQQRAKEAFRVVIDGIKRDIPAADYPGLLLSFGFPLPTALLGAPPSGSSFAGRISLATLPEFGERLNALRTKYGNNVEFKTAGSAESLGRLVAKIAHAYTVAEIGLNRFRPYLLGVIKNHDSHLFSHLIGSAMGESPASQDLHEIEIMPADAWGLPHLIVVKIHLFANVAGMAVHYVVAGEHLIKDGLTPALIASTPPR